MVQTCEQGVCYLLIFQDRITVVAYTMDLDRICEEELTGIEAERVRKNWYEGSLEETVSSLLKDRTAVSDSPIPGANYDLKAVRGLHYPLFPEEMKRMESLGRDSEKIIAYAASVVKPGMTEEEAARIFRREYAEAGIGIDVLLIGSDDRISKYRHPVPSVKRIERTVLLHTAVNRQGLHANVSRMLHFGGSLPRTLRKKYDAVNAVQAATLSRVKPGVKFPDILAVQKAAYLEFGFAAEWKNHFQGGITGYLLADVSLSLDPAAAVSVNQGFDWFITVTGVKVEELTLLNKKGVTVASAAGAWPLKRYTANGAVFDFPDILQR